MTRERWILSAATLFALWLIGALVCLPALERDLQTAAQDILARQPVLQKRLGALHVEADGQVLRLNGSVRTPQDSRAIETTVNELVRAPTPLTGMLGRHLNPVSSVHNEIEIVPYPAGWLLLAAQGTQAKLLGSAATADEARDLARSVQESWSTQGGTAEGMPGADAENHDEAANVSATLRAVPGPHAAAQAYLARIGQHWNELPLSKADEELYEEAHTLGVSEVEWQSQVLPVLKDLRAALKVQQLKQSEEERLAKLPPGYLFIAVRDREIIIRGEVGSEAIKQELLEDALSTFSPRRVHDEIRVSEARRPEGDFGPITTALLPEGDKTKGKSYFLGLSGGAWKSVDWQITAKEQAWKDELPAGLKARAMQDDSAVLSTWLEGDNSHAPAPSQTLEPAFMALALFGDRAILSGQVAEEAVRSQLIAAARSAYGPRYLVMSDDVHVRGDCEPSRGILHTVKCLPPPPAANSAGLFAIAKPGGNWTLIPVTRELVEAGGLAKSGSLPAGIPATIIENVTAETIEQLRLRPAPPVSR
ncbi:hypothetical protein [Prosthecobacter sp.]|uniref:hypothetical protein n=1 Tax=Prosthecobacter sp. TaxID=1965333 RepID=UPI0037844B83